MGACLANRDEPKSPAQIEIETQRRLSDAELMDKVQTLQTTPFCLHLSPSELEAR